MFNDAEYVESMRVHGGEAVECTGVCTNICKLATS